jgi:outer membrane protein OmpA-like peptidoglycan-associated protein
MKMSGKTLVIASGAIIVALAGSGCATKKYARNQAGAVNQRVTQVQTQIHGELAKHQSEISSLNERLTTTNNQVAAAASSAEQANASAAQANTSASQAMQQAQSNSSAISETSEQLKTTSTTITKLINAQNYTLVETANVMFGLNRSDLTPAAKAALDAVVQRALAQPRMVIEVEGFTDQTGSASYNEMLSQKRADTVARYLVKQNVPLKSISMIGLGEESAPELLAAEYLAIDPNANVKDLKSLARRVRIRVYAPGDSGVSSAGTGTGTGADSTAGTDSATGAANGAGTDSAAGADSAAGTDNGAGTDTGPATAPQSDSDSDHTATDRGQR